MACGRTWRATPARPRRATLRRRAGRRRHVPRPVRAARAEAANGCTRWRAEPLILALANPEPEIMPEYVAAAPARTRSSPPAAATIRTRSTTSCASPSSSAARWMSGATTINEEMKHRRGGGAGGARANGGERGSGRGLWRFGAAVRAGIHHPEALRSAIDPGDRPGRRPCRHGERGSDRADRGFRSV